MSGDELRRVHELLERIGNVLRAEARGVDGALQPVQVQALAYLARANRYSNTPAALAEYLGITRGTVSQTVGVLERKGLLARTPDPKDGRKSHLRPTPAGQRLLREAVPAPALREALGEDAAAALASQLTALLAGLQRQRGGRAFGVCASCRHLRREADGTRCGLTGEPLRAEDTQQLCREHAAPSPDPHAQNP